MFERTDVVFYEVSSGSPQDSMKRSALFVCLCLLPQTLGGSVVVEEGRDVILPCSLGDSVAYKRFEWKKDGQKEVFGYTTGIHTNNGRGGQAEQFKGRVSHFQGELTHGNASIKITNTKVDDSGDYTCDFPSLQPRQTFHVKLVVEFIFRDRSVENIPDAAPKPYVTSRHQTEDWALLQCDAHGAPELEVKWQDRDGNIISAEEPQVSKRGGLSYITVNTAVTKTGHYRCVATQENIGHTISAETYVRLTDAAPKPSVKILDQTEDRAHLQCDAHGAPELEVKWQDSDGNIISAEEPQVLERGGLLYITVNTTVTKTGHYRCVATQENIGHTISAETFVRLTEPNHTGLIVGGVFVILFIGLLLIVFYIYRTKQKRIKKLQEKMKKYKINKAARKKMTKVISELQEKKNRINEDTYVEMKKILKDADERKPKISKSGFLLRRSASGPREEMKKIKVISAHPKRTMSDSDALEEIKKLDEEALEKMKKLDEDADEKIKKLDEEAHEKMKKLDEEALEEIKRILKDADEKIKKINEDADEEMKKIVEARPKRTRSTPDADEEIEKLDEGSSPESVPLNELNPPV